MGLELEADTEMGGVERADTIDWETSERRTEARF